MTILSYDEESFKRGFNEHPLPQEVLEDIKTYLDEKLISLIMQNIDIVLDYSFWSREMRNEYISLLKKYDIEPKMYYIKTPKEVCMERIRKRNGNHQNDIILTEQTASTYYDHFQPPTDCTFRINGAPFPRQRCKRLAPAVRYPFVVTC